MVKLIKDNAELRGANDQLVQSQQLMHGEGSELKLAFGQNDQELVKQKQMLASLEKELAEETRHNNRIAQTAMEESSLFLQQTQQTGSEVDDYRNNIHTFRNEMYEDQLETIQLRDALTRAQSDATQHLRDKEQQIELMQVEMNKQHGSIEAVKLSKQPEPVQMRAEAKLVAARLSGDTQVAEAEQEAIARAVPTRIRNECEEQFKHMQDNFELAHKQSQATIANLQQTMHERQAERTQSPVDASDALHVAHTLRDEMNAFKQSQSIQVNSDRERFASEIRQAVHNAEVGTRTALNSEFTARMMAMEDSGAKKEREANDTTSQMHHVLRSTEAQKEQFEAHVR